MGLTWHLCCVVFCGMDSSHNGTTGEDHSHCKLGFLGDMGIPRLREAVVPLQTHMQLAEQCHT